MTADTSSHTTTLWVCVTCKTRQDDVIVDPNAGEALYHTLKDTDLESDLGVKIQPVRCLGSCKAACAIALHAKDKWGYVFAACDAHKNSAHIRALPQLLQAYQDSPTGELKKTVRPAAFQGNVRGRIPPAVE